MSRPVLPFATFLLVSLAILGGMHAYLWVRLVRDPGLPDGWRRLSTVLLAALTLAVPAGVFAVRLGSGRIARLLPIAAFTWLGVAFLLFCALAALDLARLAARGATSVLAWLRSAPDLPDPGRRAFVARAVAGGAVLAAGGAGVLAFRSATGPAEVTEIPVRLERLPPALSGFTIAQITDLHVGPTIRAREVRRVVEQTNALRPDLVAITGDLVDGSVRELGEAVSHLAALRARHGVYFVTGNHEYYSGVEEWIAYLRRLGVRVLRNERVAIGDAGASLDLAGVDDWSAGRFGNGHGVDLPRALAGRDPARSLVLLAHQPRGVPEAIGAGVELQLSGHTHGGQLFPFNLLVAAAYPYVKGLYALEEAGTRGHVYVSRGTGYWGPPMRLGSPPELARIILT
ncbi:metallophosphoesterase [Anaeromyxobacter oryzisoli]|uniref:metallophosphoesterase n=1 Tax=Anaeromyxobacter oryzisoli TaxID=2925408 RepID=UPI001F58ED34|nr:metallophosphoesterase [Anaeromyxobacter sp. SG63]